MKKYKSIFNNYLATMIEYRSELASMLILEAISLSGTLVLWLAAFRSNSEVAGYTLSKTLLYYIFIPFIGFITNISISQTIGDEIKQGKFSMHLLRPYKFYLVQMMNVLASKLNFLVFVSPLYLALIIYFIFNGSIHFTLMSVAMALVISIFAFVFHFAFDYCLGLCAFWFDDIWAFRHVKEIFFAILGGISFPLEFISGPLKEIILILPFRYLYYVPIHYILNTQADTHLFFYDLLTLIAWTGVFAVISIFIWSKGLKKYEAFGN